MPDDKPTNEIDPAGKEAVKGGTDDKEDISELDKLKTSNDEIEKELIRGRELRAEGQKLEAEKMLGGHTVAGQEAEKPKEETPKEYSDRVMKNEVKND